MQKLEIPSNAVKTLKSFANINTGMVFKPGHKLEVAHPQKLVIGMCDAGIITPEVFAIYDVSKFLGVLSLHDKDSTEFQVDGNLILIKSKRAVTKYRVTDPTNVVCLPDQFNLDMSKETGRFALSEKELEEIKTVSNSLSLPHVVFNSDATDQLTIDVKDIKNDACDEHDIKSTSLATGGFADVVFKTELLSMLMPYSYDVVLTSKFAHFVSSDKKTEYYVTVEASK